MQLDKVILSNAAEVIKNLRRQAELLAEEICLSGEDSTEEICREAAMLFETSAILERASALEKDFRWQAGEHT